MPRTPGAHTYRELENWLSATTARRRPAVKTYLVEPASRLTGRDLQEFLRRSFRTASPRRRVVATPLPGNADVLEVQVGKVTLWVETGDDRFWQQGLAPRPPRRGPGRRRALGAGKSSLLAVAGALGRPDGGSVRVHGTEVTTLSKGAAARFRLANIGFVFQAGNLLPALTAEDQLRLVARLAGNRAADARAMLESGGMAHRAHHRPGALSGGERQRVGIARALVNRPTLILADEPTAALDRRRSHEVAQLLADRAHEAGVAVVIVTHDHDILVHCDRVLEMVDGRLTEIEHPTPAAA